jgi:hypothetical protein
MNDPVLIERTELFKIVRKAVIQANRHLLQELNGKTINPWITQNHASILLGKGGRGKLDRAMKKGIIKFHKRDPDKKLGRVMVCYEDIEKLLNNPRI